MSGAPTRLETIPRYELHLTAGGAVALLVTAEGTEYLTPRGVHLTSVSKAIRSIEKHNRGPIDFSFDGIGGFAAAKNRNNK
jgi:hypothetical protein